MVATDSLPSTKIKCCGLHHGKATEFWNLNNVIYGIKMQTEMLESLKNPVMRIFLSCFTGGMNITDKGFGWTHSAFLSTWIKPHKYAGM